MMKFSISAKLILSFILVLSFGGGVGVYFLLVAERALQNSVGQSSLFLAEDLIERIDKDIADKIKQIQLYTRDASLQVALERSNKFFEELEDLSAYIAKEDEAWQAVPAHELNPLMRDLIENNVSGTLRQEFLEFWQQQYGFPVYGEAFVTNRYGLNIAQTGRTSDYYQADEEWWQQAVEKGFFVNDIEYDESAQTWTMPMGVRVEDSQGNLLGVVKAIPLAEKLFRQAELTGRRYQTTETQLLTKDGSLMYSTLPFVMFDDLSQQPFFQQAREGKGFFVSQENGRKRLFAYTRSVGFHDFPGLQWILLISHDTQEVFSPIQALRRTLGFSGVGLLALTFVFMAVLTRMISVPLRKLMHAVEHIGKGNLNTRIDLKGKDEIGQLAETFNEMTEKLQESHEDLEGKVRERTKQMEDRVQELDRTAKLLVRRDFEFMQANEFLREMDEAKSRFVSIAAHQLRTPLAGIEWTLQMLLSGDFGKLRNEQKNVLREAYETLRRLVSLVKDLLSVARIEEGRMEFTFSPLSMEAVAQKVFEASALAAENKKITLKLVVPSKPLPKISGDTVNLAMALQNMVDNAIAYTREGGRVEIAVQRHEGANKKVKVSVRDTGVGIPEDQKALIGQKFFRADNVTRQKVYGTGLGLYIAKKILEKHNGKLEFESTEGKGSTFFFILPFQNENVSV